MSQVQEKILKFKRPDPSKLNNKDVMGFRIRTHKDDGAGSASNYDLPFHDIGQQPDGADGLIAFDLTSLEGADQFDGVYDIAVTAYDDNAPKANESDFLEVENATFDFSPPDAPTDGSVS